MNRRKMCEIYGHKQGYAGAVKASLRLTTKAPATHHVTQQAKLFFYILSFSTYLREIEKTKVFGLNNMNFLL